MISEKIKHLFSTPEQAMEALQIDQKLYDKIMAGQYTKLWLVRKLITDYGVRPHEVLTWQKRT